MKAAVKVKEIERRELRALVSQDGFVYFNPLTRGSAIPYMSKIDGTVLLSGLFCSLEELFQQYPTMQPVYEGDELIIKF